mmetsp:Transcript_94947/g.239334  ORF Transcript_94947/g.239334 Transcript_94947/m.239334 type:complete len:181 (-) Transcript_94947:9-551(-)
MTVWNIRHRQKKKMEPGRRMPEMLLRRQGKIQSKRPPVMLAHRATERLVIMELEMGAMLVPCNQKNNEASKQRQNSAASAHGAPLNDNAVMNLAGIDMRVRIVLRRRLVLASEQSPNSHPQEMFLVCECCGSRWSEESLLLSTAPSLPVRFQPGRCRTTKMALCKAMGRQICGDGPKALA